MFLYIALVLVGVAQSEAYVCGLPRNCHCITNMGVLFCKGIHTLPQFTEEIKNMIVIMDIIHSSLNLQEVDLKSWPSLKILDLRDNANMSCILQDTLDIEVIRDAICVNRSDNISTPIYGNESNSTQNKTPSVGHQIHALYSLLVLLFPVLSFLIWGVKMKSRNHLETHHIKRRRKKVPTPFSIRMESYKHVNTDV